MVFPMAFLMDLYCFYPLCSTYFNSRCSRQEPHGSDRALEIQRFLQGDHPPMALIQIRELFRIYPAHFLLVKYHEIPICLVKLKPGKIYHVFLTTVDVFQVVANHIDSTMISPLLDPPV